MMRLALLLALATASSTGMTAAAAAMPGAALLSQGARGPAPEVSRVEYYCSPGYEPSYGGTCVAVPPRAEIQLFVDQPLYAAETVRVVRHRRHRYGLRERF